MVSLDEIKKIQSERKNIKKEIYKKIYNDFSGKIKKAVDIGHEQIILKTPSYIWGSPTYDVYKATLYLKRQFDHSGFTTYLFSQDEIYISWAPPQKEGPRKRIRTQSSATEEDEDFPKFVNLKKMANKLRKQ